MSTTFNTLGDGILALDSSKRIRIFNPAAEKIFGYSAKEIIGRDVFTLIEKEFHCKYSEILEAYMEMGAGQPLVGPQEISGLRKDGSFFPMEFVVNIVKMEPSLTKIAIVRDITKRKGIEAELENHRQSLECMVESRTSELRLSMEKLMETNLRLTATNSHRSHFIASISHELRTPLSVILGYANLYKKKYGISAHKDENVYIDNIANAGKHSLNLINGLLDLTKI